MSERKKKMVLIYIYCYNWYEYDFFFTSGQGSNWGLMYLAASRVRYNELTMNKPFKIYVVYIFTSILLKSSKKTKI